MTDVPSTVALVGSWADPFGERHGTAVELGMAWPSPSRVTVFAATRAAERERLSTRGVSCWPEGAFGRHFGVDEFDHVVLAIGSRLDSVVSLARTADNGCHVWLQDDALHTEGLPVDAPDDWLSDVVASARSLIVGSDWLAGVVRRLAPDGPPILVLPPAHPVVASIADVPGRTIALIGGDESVRRYLADELSAHVVRLDDGVTPDVVEARVLSARAGVEIRTSQRGFASTAVTHMMARGVPTITTLAAHAPFAADDLDSTGLVVIDAHDDSVDDLVARLAHHVRPVLDDDRAWLGASTAAKTTAASWTWSDAADVLGQWVDSADALPRSTVRVVGAVAS